MTADWGISFAYKCEKKNFFISPSAIWIPLLTSLYAAYLSGVDFWLLSMYYIIIVMGKHSLARFGLGYLGIEYPFFISVSCRKNVT
ncbi:MAG: hypothetical protein ACRCU2_31490, partial [Planktothrix sp.]